MRKSRRLEMGDSVGVVAPASPFKRERFDQGVAEIERLGFRPVVSEATFARDGYLAGDPVLRATALTESWSDDSVMGLIAARGGYGSAQILPLLDKSLFCDSCKQFVGHSDLTAFLAYLTTHCGVVCFHGPMVMNLAGGESSYDRDSLLRVVMNAEPLGELTGDRLETLYPGEAVGPILGGTLTQLAASLGTPHAFSPPPGYVLLLDDLNEQPYRIDRMLTQLSASGLLGLASAVVCGEFPGCDGPVDHTTVREVLGRIFKAFPGPVLFGFPTGHTTGPTLTVPLGVEARVVGGRRACVAITEAAVL
ncbi:MAG: LD-carboxypeptidase [Acidobacteria bacterium]|nr:LD-carboxypeptidase [Acidobacteriota bacterium]